MPAPFYNRWGWLTDSTGAVLMTHNKVGAKWVQGFLRSPAGELVIS